MEFNLSAKEFLFVSFAAGAKLVYGIENEFSKINPEEISSEIRKVHSSLEKKNYVESDFDGNSSINKNLLNTINTCVNCSNTILLNSSAKNKNTAVNYYFDGNNTVKAEKKDNEYVLANINIEDFCADLLSNLSLREDKEFSENVEFVMLQKDLEKVKKEVVAGNKEEAAALLGEHTNEKIRDIIISALEEKEDFYSIAAINTDDSSNAFDSIMIIDTEMGLLTVKPFISGLDNAVRIINCSHSDIKTLLNSMVSKITG